jgi:membrane carboxypeptidase/penicillin-binding protein PbpC
MTANLTATNDTHPCVGKFYLPIPVDYRGKTIVASINNSKPIRIELWTQAIPIDKLQKPSEHEFMWVAQSPFINGSQQTSLTWHIDRAGYFTIRIVDKEENLENPFNLTLNLRFL